VRRHKPDIVWVEKGLTIRPGTLLQIRRSTGSALMVSFSPDDMMNPNNQTRYWRACIPLYDVHVTTKTHNLAELKSAGARRVEFMPKAFDPHTHRPIQLTDADKLEYGAEVGFAGSFEHERADSIAFLGRNDVAVRVWGAFWDRHRRQLPRNIRIEGRELFCDEYAKAICSTRINLGFLRKANRDKQTARSIEIPACAGFMLAERSDEHLGLFKENIEAEFFADDNELLAKIRYYLQHDDQRRRIADAGYRRCLESGYSNRNRLGLLLETLMFDRAVGT